MKSIHHVILLAVPLVFATDTLHAPVDQKGFPLSTPKSKRGFLTCFQTYGGGSITCGGPDSHFCYDPTLGESCCLLDEGYCKKGDFCAPVAGFCCHDGENPQTCARRLDFEIPPTTNEVPLATKALAANPSAAFAASASPTPFSTLTLKGPRKSPSSSTTSTAVDNGEAEPTSSLTSTSTITSTIHLAAATPTPEIGMTPNFKAPIGNASLPSGNIKVDAAPSRGSLAEYQGAADKGVRVMSVGGIAAVGVVVLVGLCL